MKSKEKILINNCVDKENLGFHVNRIWNRCKMLQFAMTNTFHATLDPHVKLVYVYSKSCRRRMCCVIFKLQRVLGMVGLGWTVLRRVKWEKSLAVWMPSWNRNLRQSHGKHSGPEDSGCAYEKRGMLNLGLVSSDKARHATIGLTKEGVWPWTGIEDELLAKFIALFSSRGTSLTRCSVCGTVTVFATCGCTGSWAHMRPWSIRKGTIITGAHYGRWWSSKHDRLKDGKKLFKSVWWKPGAILHGLECRRISRNMIADRGEGASLSTSTSSIAEEDLSASAEGASSLPSAREIRAIDSVGGAAISLIDGLRRIRGEDVGDLRTKAGVEVRRRGLGATSSCMLKGVGVRSDRVSESEQGVQTYCM